MMIILYSADPSAMTDHLDATGDVSQTAASFCPAKLTSFNSDDGSSVKGGLTCVKLMNCALKTRNCVSKTRSFAFNDEFCRLLSDVDAMLDNLSTLTKEDDQVGLLSRFMRETSANSDDMKWLCRLIKKDLKTRAKDKHVLEALHAEGYKMFKQNNDLCFIVSQIIAEKHSTTTSAGASRGTPLKASIALRQPIRPMLANPLKDLNAVFAKCPHGMYAEIKYDGERLQVHKDGSDFVYYS